MCATIIFHCIVFQVYPRTRRDLRGRICFLFHELFERFLALSLILLQINNLISDILDESLHVFHIHWLLVFLL